MYFFFEDCLLVALFTEGVDWNSLILIALFLTVRRPLHRGCGLKYIALVNKGESVRRRPLHRGCGLKSFMPILSDSTQGRPLHRGCGLKFKPRIDKLKLDLSPSSQRVWIEIMSDAEQRLQAYVALFTEGVDWNSPSSSMYIWWTTSPSSQRVWIEIWSYRYSRQRRPVALFTEGVDWNMKKTAESHKLHSRPLHRGCGLK